jgi:hypothetical protein
MPPTFLASGWDSPKAPRYPALRATVVAGPLRASQLRPARTPAAASTTPPIGRTPVARAICQPPISPVAISGAVATEFGSFRQFFMIPSLGGALRRP